MTRDFERRLRAYAAVILKGGLNLQCGQRLLIAEPYELQGVARSADVLVEALKSAALETAHSRPPVIEVIWGDAARLREFAAQKDWRGLARLVGANAHRMNDYVRQGDALLFLLGTEPGLMKGIPPAQVAEARRIGGEYFGAVAQELMQGATNWTAAPAPSARWADVVYADQPPTQRLASLWETIFEAVRVPSGSQIDAHPDEHMDLTNSLAAWQIHLQALEKQRDELNSCRFTSLHYQGEGTDLTVALPPEHRWCTASLRSKAGVSFVANLPTEEVFTLPLKESAQGIARVARPITFGGSVIDGIELEFRHGRVVKATAQTGETLLRRLLETDSGACQLGEVAMVGEKPKWSAIPVTPAIASQSTGDQRPRLFHHALLDENTDSHIALGEGYGFCLTSSNPAALNRSLIHVDLPIAAKAHLRV